MAIRKKKAKPEEVMAYPIRYAGFDYNIIFMSNPHRDVACYGYIEPDDFEIFINTNFHPAMQKVTILHELLHMITFHSDIRPMLGENEEVIVDRFANGIYQLFGDNPELAKLLFLRGKSR